MIGVQVSDRLSDKAEELYKTTSSMVTEMTAKEMEGFNYKRELNFLTNLQPRFQKLKRILRERGQ